MKRNNQTTIIKKYLKEIRHLLPVRGCSVKRYISDVRQAIEDYSDTVEELSFDMLVKEFGEPKSLVSNFILEQDASTLRKSMRFTNYIRYVACSIIVGVVLTVCYNYYTLYQSYIEGKKSYIAREVTVIEVIEEE